MACLARARRTFGLLNLGRLTLEESIRWYGSSERETRYLAIITSEWNVMKAGHVICE